MWVLGSSDINIRASDPGSESGSVQSSLCPKLLIIFRKYDVYRVWNTRVITPHPGSKGENGVNGEWGSAPYTKILNSSNSLNKYTIR